MLSEKLGLFLACGAPDGLPDQLVEMAKLRILDLIGAGLAGYQDGSYRPLMDVLRVSGGRSLIWGDGARTTAREAATLNSFMAHCNYLEDGSRSTGGHPSSTVIPAALALAEERACSGGRLISAVVGGYEIFLRLGAAIYPETVNRGFQPTAVLASLAAAGGCARLLGLSAEGCANALALAANFGSGLKSALKEPSTQPIQVGRGCEGGVLAALLAERGLKGHGPNLEAFLQAHGGAGSPKAILAGLGREYRMGETYLKVHGGCRGNHAPVDAAMKAVAENRVPLDQIRSIRVGIDRVTAAAEISRPKTGGEAQFSIPFSVAVALRHGNASVFQYTDERLCDPQVQGLMEKIHVDIDPEMDKLLPGRRGASIAITLADGSRFSESLLSARGEPEAPLSAAEVKAKFMLMAEGTLGPRSGKVMALVDGLETLSSVGELTGHLAAEPAPMADQAWKGETR